MKHSMILKSFVWLGTCATVLNAAGEDRTSLAGTWHMQLDPQGIGEASGWMTEELPETVRLPGTLDENQRGVPPTPSTTELNRHFVYDGAAWYQREIEIPAEWEGRRIELFLERTRFTRVWFDGEMVGSGASLSTPHRFVLTERARPGRHRLTIEVNNDPKLYPMHLSHVWADRIQTNWNGIVGRIELRATDPVWIDDVQVHASADAPSARVVLALGNRTDAEVTTRVVLDAGRLGRSEHDVHLPIGTSQHEIELAWTSAPGLWDEFSPTTHPLEVAMKCETADGRKFADRRELTFGVRDFVRQGKKFAVNGRVTFLRGKHDAGVFPLTGYAAMDEAEWERVFRVAASFGINFYRFHSWCPPEAAFRAADRMGIYLQPELPAWGSFARPGLADYLRREGEAILREFGNHPSFVMFTLGNELVGDLEGRRELVAHLRAFDSRRLYAQGSNNHFVSPEPLDVDDFWAVSATHRTGGRVVLDIDLTRGSMLHGYLGHLNNEYPSSTLVDYSRAAARSPVPLLSHETGQYLVFPDFSEMRKYTGVLRPYPMEVFQERMTKSGLEAQADAFHRASGKLAALCYKEDIESVLRTRDMAGYALLDLQDYPGQGSAWVGMCDAFMEPKSFIEPTWFRQFCAPVVPLLRFAKRTWSGSETFRARVEVAQYHRDALRDAVVHVRLFAGDNVVSERTLRLDEVTAGGVRDAGEVEFPLRDIAAPQQLRCEVSIAGTPWRNEYDLWVYPDELNHAPSDAVEIAEFFDAQVRSKLAQGGTVLLLPRLHDLRNTTEGQFIANFWTVAFFKTHRGPGTLGLLMDPEHAAFRHFPTEEHSDWQWWSMARHGRPMILDGLPRTLKPLVQVIDNFETSRKLGLLIEARVGKGRLVLSSIDFLQHRDKPEVRQLLFSLLRYMESADFAPDTEVTEEQLEQLFRGDSDKPDAVESAVDPGIHG